MSEIYGSPRSLFVAEFIGEMNQLQATSPARGQLKVGTLNLHCDAEQWPDESTGTDLVAAIRPEDIIPMSDSPDQPNHLDVSISDMAFMGSFWRSRLQNEALGGNDLIADFSINAVRRLSLQSGNRLTVELPADRLLAFPRQ